ncbi:MAG: amidohydrolase family protein [Phycisphaeraceae bacterium]|nr:MAG: amidohydrolase family protein [Phycisphaeraceae bacterium]
MNILNTIASAAGWIAAACLSAGAWAQDLTPVRGPADRSVIIRGATVHTVGGATIKDGVVVMGREITGVYTADEFRAWAATVRWAAPGPVEIDAAGKHVYPGLIGAFTTLGLEEMQSIRATRDTAEVGEVTPEASACAAVNPDSTLIPVARTNGVLIAGVFPDGGLVPGRACAIRLHGWTVEDLAVTNSGGLVVNWPWMRTVRGVDGPREDEQAKDIRARLARLTEAFDGALAYRNAKAPGGPTDVRHEAVVPFLPAPGGGPGGRVYIRANDADQITAACAFAAERGLSVVLVGGRDARLCVDAIKRAGVLGVILVGTHNLPKRADSDYDEAYRLPAALRDAGIPFCIASGQETGHERNLPYAAATAVAFGLTPEEGIRSVTLDAARLLGIGDRYGSIEAGKSATVMITDGNPLELTTRVERAFIDGVEVDLSNKQTVLYERILERYRQRGELDAQGRRAQPDGAGR